MASKKKTIILQGGGTSGIATEELEAEQINTEISISYNDGLVDDQEADDALMAAATSINEP